MPLDPPPVLVAALAFHPQLLLVASASFDSKFKLWEVTTPLSAADGAGALSQAALAASEKPPSWSCRSVGYYRQSAACAAAFSADGSLLAVAYAPDIITLWEPLTN